MKKSDESRRMTRREAIKMLERIKYRINYEVTDAQKKMDALNMAIKALEQEPCGDAISRQAVFNIFDDMVKDYVNENDFDKAQGIAWVKVQNLPPVTPAGKVVEK